VGRVRDQHLHSIPVASGVMMGSDHEKAGELAVGAGRWLE
jgi:hypothetical protein